MKVKRSTPFLIIGAYELFYAIRLFWNLGNGRLNSIIIAGKLFQGLLAEIVFVVIGLLGAAIGFGLLRLRQRAYYGFMAFNCLLVLLYSSNLLLVQYEDVVGWHRTVPDNYLLNFRLDTVRRLAVAICLNAVGFFYRKRIGGGSIEKC